MQSQWPTLLVNQVGNGCQTKSEHLHADEIVVFVVAVVLVVTVFRHNRDADHSLRFRESLRGHFHPERVCDKEDFTLGSVYMDHVCPAKLYATLPSGASVLY